MKKVVIVLIVVLVLALGGLGYVYSLYSNVHSKNVKVKKEIADKIYNIEKISEENQTIEVELNNMKETNNGKIAEIEIWKQMKEKLS